MPKKKNTYGMSDRYMSRLHTDIILNMIIIAVFYFCFNVMFRENPGYEEYISTALLILFILIAVAVVYSDLVRIRKYENIYYKVTSNYLEFCDSKKTVQYPWRHFTAVVVNKNKIGLTYPYEFRTDEGNFYLHKQTGDLEGLIPAIIEKIRPYASIDPEIPDVFNPMDSMQDDLRRVL